MIIVTDQNLSPLIQGDKQDFEKKMENRYRPKKMRRDTRDRFESVLWNRRKRDRILSKSWYLQKHNLIILVVIVVSIIMGFIVQGVYMAQQNLFEQQNTEELITPAGEEMDYEEAVEIFGG